MDRDEALGIFAVGIGLAALPRVASTALPFFPEGAVIRSPLWREPPGGAQALAALNGDES